MGPQPLGTLCVLPLTQLWPGYVRWPPVVQNGLGTLRSDAFVGKSTESALNWALGTYWDLRLTDYS